MPMSRTESRCRVLAIARWALPLAAVVSAAGCGKATEMAAEKAAEKAIESQLEKDGQKAKVDLSGSTATVNVTDASGRSSQLQIGGAKVTEADLGVPLYPGATAAEHGSTKASTPDGTMAMVQLESRDPADRVAAFYREQLKSRAQGKTFADMAGGDGSTTLVLGDEAGKQGIQIQVSKTEGGSSIVITSTRAAPR